MFLNLAYILAAFVTYSQAHIISNGYQTGYHYGHPEPVPYHHLDYHQHQVASVGTPTHYVYPAPEAIHHAAYPEPEAIQHVVYPVAEAIHHAAYPAPEAIQHAVYPAPEAIHHAVYPASTTTNHAAYPVPSYNHVAYPHQHVVPVGTTTNYVYPAAETVNHAVYPSHHGYAHPAISTARYGHGHRYGYANTHYSNHHACRTTYGTWSTWGTCIAVHKLVDTVTDCGPGRQIRSRQRKQPVTLTTPTYYRVPYVRYPTCTASCAPSKELFQVQQCTVVPGIVATCVETPMPMCDFQAPALICDPAVVAQAGFTTAKYQFATAVAGANTYLQLGAGVGTLPLGVYWPTIVFPPSANYKYCVRYKAQLDAGTMLFASYLSVPAVVPAANQLAFLCANALLAADNYVDGARCEGEGVFRCDIGTTSTTSLKTYQQEITVKDAFGIGFFMIPSEITTGLGYSAGQLDDIEVVAGGC